MTGSKQALAVPKSLYESENVYVIYSAEKNGEKRDFVRKVVVTVGVEYDGFYEVLSGLNFSDRIVMECNVELADGCEIILTQ